MSFARIFLFFFLIDIVSMYTKVPFDYDLYGIKIGINDRFLVSVDNLVLVWYGEIFPHSNISGCLIFYNLTTCSFVYSVVVPTLNNVSLASSLAMVRVNHFNYTMNKLYPTIRHKIIL